MQKWFGDKRDIKELVKIFLVENKIVFDRLADL